MKPDDSMGQHLYIFRRAIQSQLFNTAGLKKEQRIVL